MTMTRTERRDLLAGLTEGPHAGYTAVRFESPRLVRAARAERGHTYMTRAEYVEHRMTGRSTMTADMIEARIERLAALHRAARMLGGRRVNGYRHGYRPGAYSVERCTLRR